MNAFKAKFPNIKFYGCHFHHGQSFYRKVGGLGLKKNYDKDEEFAAAARTLLALSFVPPHEVIEYFEHIVDSNIIPPIARGLVQYFEKTYIGQLPSSSAGPRSKPTFSIESWNCYQRVLKDGDFFFE